MAPTFEALLAFETTGWEAASDCLRASTRRCEEAAELLLAVADRMAEAWGDEIGELIARRCRAQAGLIEAQAAALGPSAAMLEDGAHSMAAVAEELRALTRRAEVMGLGLTRDEEWAPTLPPADPADPLGQAKRRASLDAVRALAASILHRADLIDRHLASVLAEATGASVAQFDLGPLELSDRGLALAADLTAQGPTAPSAWVAALMVLAGSNPGHLRDHLAWSQQAQAYTVTLYDPASGAPVPITVSPSTLPEFPSNAMTQEADFVGVYTAALEARFPGEVDPARAGQILLGRWQAPLGPTEVGLGELRATLEGQNPAAVLVTTRAAPQPTGEILPNHTYVASGLTPDGGLVLRNPHGPGAPAAIVTLPATQYLSLVAGVTIWQGV